jgi:hypothetical protein
MSKLELAIIDRASGNDDFIRHVQAEIINELKNKKYSINALLELGLYIPLAARTRLYNRLLEQDTVMRKQHIKSMVSDGPFEHKDVSTTIESYLKKPKSNQTRNPINELIQSIWVFLKKNNKIQVYQSAFSSGIYVQYLNAILTIRVDINSITIRADLPNDINLLINAFNAMPDKSNVVHSIDTIGRLVGLNITGSPSQIKKQLGSLIKIIIRQNPANQ